MLIDHPYFFKCKFPFFYVVVFVMIHNILLCIYKYISILKDQVISIKFEHLNGDDYQCKMRIRL